MLILKLLLRIIAILLLIVGIFGGVLDVAEIANMPISRGFAIAVALALVAIDRELKVLALDWQLKSRRDLQQRIDRLAEFREEAVTKLYAGTPQASNFEAWKNHFHKWEDSLVAYLKDAFPYAVYEMFQDQGMIPSENFQQQSSDPAIRDQHLNYLRRIAKHLTVLERLIQENTSLTKEREPSFRELFGA